MAEITAEMLRQKIAEMQATVAAHTGAIEICQYFLAVLAENDGGGGGVANEMTADEFAQAVAGNGAVVESIEAVE